MALTCTRKSVVVCLVTIEATVGTITFTILLNFVEYAPKEKKSFSHDVKQSCSFSLRMVFIEDWYQKKFSVVDYFKK